MSPFLQNHHRAKQKKTVRHRRTFDIWNSKFVRGGVAACALTFAALFFLTINSVAVKGYAVRELDMKSRELGRETKALELDIARLTSMETLASRVAQLGFVSGTKLEFITPSDTQVAQR